MGAIISLFIFLVVVGLLWWCLTLVPLPAPIATIAQVVFILFVVLLLLSWLFGGINIPTVRLGAS